MHHSINKKIFLYLLILILFASINNKNFLDSKILKLDDFSVSGLSEDENYNLKSKFTNLKNQNIFFIDSNKIKKILDSDDLIESYNVQKIYPSKISIDIKKTKFLANTSFDSKNFFIGSNKKFVESNIINPELPFIFGRPSVENFFDIKKKIELSSFNFSDIEKFHFFPSQRWNIEFKNGVLIKLPELSSLKSLNEIFEIVNSEKFNKVKVFDLRINGQLITNEL